MNRAWIALSIASLFAIALVFAGTIDPRQSDEAHLAYGKKFPFVAKISCTDIKSGDLHSGSCVIISPRCALTAAHVVNGGKDPYVVTDDGKKHEIERVVIHPKYDESQSGVGDLAVCLVSQAGEFSLDFYPALHSGDDEVGKVASIAGYGFKGTFHSGATNSDGKRRAGANVIERVKDDLLVCSAGGKRKNELEFLISWGDSGGGLFIGNELAGINSFIMSYGEGVKPRSKYGEESAHVRISHHIEWIKKNAAF